MSNKSRQAATFSIAVIVFTLIVLTWAFIAHKRHVAQTVKLSPFVAVYTAQDLIKFYNAQGNLLAQQTMTLPASTPTGGGVVSIATDQNSLRVADISGRLLFSSPLKANAMVTVLSSYDHSQVKRGRHLAFIPESDLGVGDGVMSETPYRYSLVISPNYKSRFLW